MIKRTRLSRAKSGMFVLVFAVIASMILIATQAATSGTAFEAESGALTGGATLQALAGASGGNAVKFAGGTSANCGVGTTDLSCWPNDSNTGYQNAPRLPWHARRSRQNQAHQSLILEYSLPAHFSIAQNL